MAEQKISDPALLEKIWKVLEEVYDPEIPTLSIVDLGIVSAAEVDEDGKISVEITPTFAGCPAIEHIRQNIRNQICAGLGTENVAVKVNFTHPWNTNRMTEKGRLTLKKIGLAPPPRYENELNVETVAKANCPYCNSENTTMNTPFGPTLCRSIHYCFDCLQSFEQFKPL